MSFPITLQRASAGSGKTYTLTKKFIRLLISIAKDGRPARLRNEGELRDALNHILAVTFTNKATDEMKQRIMSCLAALAVYDPAADAKRPAYLDDFTEEFGVGDEEISRRCMSALKFLLYNYSEFKVHTIDAFFQSMLRTFAYEADLPDSYEVIVDNNYLNKQVVMDLIRDIARGTADPEVRNWVKRMIRMKERDGKQSSDVFNFKESSGRKKSLFDEMCIIARDFDMEANKSARESLEVYIDRNRDRNVKLEDVYEELEHHFAKELIGKMRRVVDSAREVLEEGARIESATGMALGDYIANGSRTIGSLHKLAEADAEKDAEAALTWNNIDWHADNFYAKSKFNTKAKKAIIISVESMAGGLLDTLNELTSAYNDWNDYKENKDYLCWKHLSQGFPRVGLLMDLMERARNFLLETGTMRLSDTNTMLSRIIGGDELAFIYERYGARLDHFLIDEFQDTSLMQWENFLPLLNNSKSEQHENLIIGDAKQSIYRFRGADPTLITEKVPSEFAGYIDERGNLEEENANRRSSRHIVEFNNYIFRALSDNLVDNYDERIRNLYGNTVQRPANTADEGYVEVNICRAMTSSSSDEDIESEEENAGDSAQESAADKVAVEIKRTLRDTIFDLLGRGYEQREIAILVNSNKAGKDVIAYLRDCNKNLPAGIPLLEFVSEDSLTLGSSRAVECVIDCLRMIQKGIEGERMGTYGNEEGAMMSTDESGEKERRDGREDRNKKRLNWVDIAPQFRSYCLHNEKAGDTLQERIERFLNLSMIDDESQLSESEREELEKFREDPMDAMLRDMYAVTLPSLVEALAERFVPMDLLQKESIYLAALQDAVIEYCKIYPADIASMLKWWDTYGKNTTIVSPEGTNAITVMSIHKSKGLEFECVLLPDFNIDLKLKYEWTWVDVPQDFPLADKLPEKMPICLYESDKNRVWSASPFAKIQSEARYYNMADQVNKAYVAMTRPVSELYIFLKGTKSDFAGKVEGEDGKAPSASFRSISSSIKTLTRDFEENVEICSAEERRFLPPAESLREEIDENPNNETIILRYCYGKKSEKAAEDGSSLADRRRKKRSRAEERPIERYFVNSDRGLLQYQPEGKPVYVDAADDDRIDPREEGTKLHAVLEKVKVAADLDKSFERMRIRGTLSREEISRYKPILKGALESVADRGWFDGSRQVLNERALLNSGEGVRRPDRVLLSDDGTLTVIDYKFKFVKGDEKQKSAHHSQVRRYMRHLQNATGAKEVEGYLWYINDGYRLEEVSLRPAKAMPGMRKNNKNLSK